MARLRFYKSTFFTLCLVFVFCDAYCNEIDYIDNSPLFSIRKIIIDKDNETLILISVFGIFSPTSKLIKFSQINKIEIKEDSLGRGDAGTEGEGAGRDKIYLDLKGKGYIKLDDSYSDRYTNNFVNKLSEEIGCKVVCVRW